MPDHAAMTDAQSATAPRLQLGPLDAEPGNEQLLPRSTGHSANFGQNGRRSDDHCAIPSASRHLEQS